MTALLIVIGLAVTFVAWECTSFFVWKTLERIFPNFGRNKNTDE